MDGVEQMSLQHKQGGNPIVGIVLRYVYWALLYVVCLPLFLWLVTPLQQFNPNIHYYGWYCISNCTTPASAEGQIGFDYHLFGIILILFLGLASVIGTSCILVQFCSSEKYRKLPHLRMVAFLAFSDLLFAFSRISLVAMMLGKFDLAGSPGVCTAIGFLNQLFGSFGVNWSFVLTTNLFLVVFAPHAFAKWSSGVVMFRVQHCYVWGMALLTCLVQLPHFEYNPATVCNLPVAYQRTSDTFFLCYWTWSIGTLCYCIFKLRVVADDDTRKTRMIRHVAKFTCAFIASWFWFVGNALTVALGASRQMQAIALLSGSFNSSGVGFINFLVWYSCLSETRLSQTCSSSCCCYSSSGGLRGAGWAKHHDDDTAASSSPTLSTIETEGHPGEEMMSS